ncbi:MAG: Gfo/Idh/MocA family oxidoreductase [SAR202 cluster bacterium]|nr:Gfo/Idh/MocA family oxidoreductase [SAR202 cluster bacterium]|tara:strand:- start:13385 stop:14569 length:1185 start_codon:yes stop_codon:yes gene_type:complete
MTNNKKPNIRIAIIGSGFSATFHIENYKKVHGIEVEIAGIFSRNIQKTKDFAKIHQIENVYHSLEDVLTDQTIDMVDICTPNALHEEFAVKVLESGKHVAVEKPFTGVFSKPNNIDEWNECLKKALNSSDKMIKAEIDSKKNILYAENWVYAPGISKAINLLNVSNSRILRIVAEESHSGTHSKYAMNWETSGGGSLLNKGCHPLGGSIYLKNLEGSRISSNAIKPDWVQASTTNLTKSNAFIEDSNNLIRTGWANCEDWGHMIVGFSDGSIAQIGANDTSLGGINNFMTIYSTQSVIKINMNPNDSVMSYSTNQKAFENEYIREKVETKAGWQYTNPDEDWINGFPQEMQDFCESIAYNRPPLSNSQLGRSVVQTCYSAYLSAHSGSKIKISG